MFTTRPELLGTFGVVTTTHWLGTATGMAILEKGGNAFDAAVATGFALQVVEPHLNGPGGDMPAIFHVAGEDSPRVLCGQGPIPAAATMGKFGELGLDLIPGSGLLCAVVPGAFDAWLKLLRDHGTMSLAEVMGPAIAFARDGYPVVPRITATIDTVRELFANEWKTSAALYLPGGKPPAPGTIFSNPVMAETYARVIAEAEAGGGSREARIDRARRIWSQGWIAERIDNFMRTEEVMDVTGRRHSGLLTGEDMAAWSASYDAPATYDYGRFTVCKPGPWSQGPALLQQLAILDGMGLSEMDPAGPDFVHTVVEAAKLAFADREAYYGDPDFVDVPMETLLSREYNAARRAMITSEASPDLRPGAIDGYRVEIGMATQDRSGVEAAASMGVGEPTVAKTGVSTGDTVHLDIIDRHGNMISCTPSGGWLQSSPIIPELGFCLGNRGQMFWLDEKTPSALVPNKRPRTTLSPSLALRDGEPYMVFGTPGGDQQDQWSALMFLHHAEHGMNLQESIDCPAFHTEHFPSSFWPRGRTPKKVVVEGRFPETTVAELRRRGHEVEVGDNWSEGRLTGAARDGRLLKAGANPRGMQGYAAGR
ncbi:MAG: gamma-glutamyltransferase family protein [Alphaproteobacteria bacterium]|jgi:gamma-glutamyltranspeptidase/glutathione hydrolase|nr:gamma-glutamyltransferase family protein [Alphaproteobacteria bacterium]